MDSFRLCMFVTCGILSIWSIGQNIKMNYNQVQLEQIWSNQILVPSQLSLQFLEYTILHSLKYSVFPRGQEQMLGYKVSWFLLLKVEINLKWYVGVKYRLDTLHILLNHILFSESCAKIPSHIDGEIIDRIACVDVLCDFLFKFVINNRAIKALPPTPYSFYDRTLQHSSNITFYFLDSFNFLRVC